ncbi:MAG: hypothetical protein ACOX4U_08545 [Anaerovoracaceae bacterium]|jgi:hypothetical protein
MDNLKEKGNFLIRIHNNQNATWQGTVTWLDKNSKENFRSLLEMIRLLDSALNEENLSNGA